MDSIYVMDTETLMQLIAERVQTLREQKGWTQQTLADKADVSQTSVSNAERAAGLGRKSITIESANKIATALGVELWQLCLPPESFLPQQDVVDLIRAYSKANPEGRGDICKIADLAAKYSTDPDDSSLC